jgi:hypothetical protein
MRPTLFTGFSGSPGIVVCQLMPRLGAWTFLPMAHFSKYKKKIRAQRPSKTGKFACNGGSFRNEENQRRMLMYRNEMQVISIFSKDKNTLHQNVRFCTFTLN